MTSKQNTTTGEHFDSFLGLQYLRARWYAPTLGAFTRRDPYPGATASPLTFLRYAYAADDPVNALDPSGMISFSLSELTTATSLSMTLGASFGGAIGVQLTGTTKGAVAGAISGAALGAAFSMGSWPLLFKAELTGLVQGILQVVADEITHSSLKHSESFLRGFSKGAWGTVLKIAFPYHNEVLVAAISTLLFSISDSISAGIFDFRQILTTAARDVVVAVLANCATGPSLPLSVRQRLTLEIPGGLEILQGAVVAFDLPIAFHDLQGLLSFFGYNSLGDFWSYLADRQY